MQLCTLNGKVVDSYFSHAQFPFKVVFQKAPRMNFGRVDLEEGAAAGGTIDTFLIPSILLNFCLFMALEHILSLVLRSCPGTGLVKMNVEWSILDSYFSHPLFVS